MDVDELDRVGAGYLEHLTGADLRALAHAEQEGPAAAQARMDALRREPALVLDILDRPETSSAILNLAADRNARRFTFVSPFLVFAAAIHRTAADLTTSSYVPERTTPRQRVPVLDAMQLAAYLAQPRRRLFLAELLASFARTSGGVAVVQTARGPRRQRWNELDPTRLAVLLDAVPEPQRPGVWRRLGDLALFLSGVFPDSLERSAVSRIDVTRLAQRTGLPADPTPGLDAATVFEWLGTGWYRLAAHRAMSVTSATRLLRDTAEHFHHARRVLNSTTDRYLFPVGTDWFVPPR